MVTYLHNSALDVEFTETEVKDAIFSSYSEGAQVFFPF
jgi:hypothetical protein